jgi:hypothetical protein
VKPFPDITVSSDHQQSKRSHAKVFTDKYPMGSAAACACKFEKLRNYCMNSRKVSLDPAQEQYQERKGKSCGQRCLKLRPPASEGSRFDPS